MYLNIRTELGIYQIQLSLIFREYNIDTNSQFLIGKLKYDCQHFRQYKQKEQSPLPSTRGKRPRSMTWEMQVLAWNRHNNVTELAFFLNLFCMLGKIVTFYIQKCLQYVAESFTLIQK
jgi:hypothetical protein